MKDKITIIGDPTLFAIKFKIDTTFPSLLGRVALFLGGELIGDFEESHIYLRSVQKQLNDLIHRDINFDEFRGFDDQEKFGLILSGNERYDTSILSLSESFDGYLLRAYILDDDLQFIWMKLGANEDELDKEIKTVKLQVSYYSSVVKNFGEQLG